MRARFEHGFPTMALTAARHSSGLGFFVLMTLTVFVADALAQLFLFPGRHESLGYFPSAVALGAMWRFGMRRSAPPLLTGLVAYYVLVYALPLWASVWTSATLLMSAAVAILLMRRFIGPDPADRPLASLMTFYGFAVLLMPVLHSFADLPMFIEAGLIDPNQDLRFYFLPYWLGEALGVLLVAPPIFLMGRDYSRFYRGERAVYRDIGREKLLWSALFTVLITLVVLQGDTYLLNGINDLGFVLFGMMLWGALRLGVMFSMMAVAVVTVSIVLFGYFGFGGTPAMDDLHQLVAMLSMLLTIALMTQIISVVRLERLLRQFDLAHAAAHDWITDLLNMRSIEEALRAAARRWHIDKRRRALGYIIVDQHEILGQGFGLQARHALLSQFGNFVAGVLREDAVLGRISGGEFAVVYDCAFDSARENLATVARRLGGFRFARGGRSFRVDVRLAILPVEEHPVLSGERLLNYAGNVARNAPGGDLPIVVETLDDGELETQRSRAAWLADIQEALSDQRWHLLAQPIVPIGAPEQEQEQAPGTHFEILLRMRAPDGHDVVPGEFMPYAEEFRLMPELDRWVIEHSCRWLASDAVDMERVGLCSVNLSGQSLGDSRTYDFIAGTLRRTGVPAHKLCFEVTETAAIANFRVAVELLERLHALGCLIALDDFGTGLASFEYLRSLPLDYLKIDGLFVRQMTAASLDYAIVESINNVARFKGVRTVAEFVEHESTVGLLRALGIDYAQGYATGRPGELSQLACTRAQAGLA
jgi:EAL domain-containing protein (putative c-di-GMP-specific phosphodiesterase class I)/GGDEF domain-containing protein